MPKTAQRRWYADGANAVPGGGVSLPSGERGAQWKGSGSGTYLRRARKASDKRADLRSLAERTGREIVRMPPVTRKRRRDVEGTPIPTMTETVVARLTRETAERTRSAQVQPFTLPDAPYRAFGMGAPRERA